MDGREVCIHNQGYFGKHCCGGLRLDNSSFEPSCSDEVATCLVDGDNDIEAARASSDACRTALSYCYSAEYYTPESGLWTAPRCCFPRRHMCADLAPPNGICEDGGYGDENWKLIEITDSFDPTGAKDLLVPQVYSGDVEFVPKPLGLDCTDCFSKLQRSVDIIDTGDTNTFLANGFGYQLRCATILSSACAAQQW